MVERQLSSTIFCTCNIPYSHDARGASSCAASMSRYFVASFTTALKTTIAIYRAINSNNKWAVSWSTLSCRSRYNTPTQRESPAASTTKGKASNPGADSWVCCSKQRWTTSFQSSSSAVDVPLSPAEDNSFSIEFDAYSSWCVVSL